MKTIVDSMILWIGTLVPGKFCKADQDRVAAAYGPGYVHFHQKFVPGTDPNAGHGGKGGEDGFWYRHIAVTKRPGDCCVYCSYADRPCPPKQLAVESRRPE